MGSSDGKSEGQGSVSYVRHYGDGEDGYVEVGLEGETPQRYGTDKWQLLLRQSVWLREGRPLTKGADARDVDEPVICQRDFSEFVDDGEGSIRRVDWKAGDVMGHISHVGEVPPPSDDERPVIRHLILTHYVAAAKARLEQPEINARWARLLSELDDHSTTDERQAEIMETDLRELPTNPYGDMFSKYEVMSDKALSKELECAVVEEHPEWGDSIKEVRASAGRTAKDAATALGMSPATYGAIEQNDKRHALTVAEARLIADVTGRATISELIGELGEDDVESLALIQGAPDPAEVRRLLRLFVKAPEVLRRATIGALESVQTD